MLLSIDGTFIFVFISFIIFLFLMNLICYKPITKVIEERQKFFDKNKKTVDETNMKIKTTIEKMQGEISQTKFEGSKILKTSMEDNKRQKESAIQTKKEEIAASLSELKKELDNSSNQAKEELKNEVEMHVKSTVAKILNIDYNDISVDGNKIDEILK